MKFLGLKFLKLASFDWKYKTIHEFNLVDSLVSSWNEAWSTQSNFYEMVPVISKLLVSIWNELEMRHI